MRTLGKCYQKLEEKGSLLCSGREFSNTIACKVESVPKKPRNLAKEISRPCLNAPWFSSAAYIKVQEGQYNLKRELSDNKDSRFTNFQNPQISRWQMMLKSRNGFQAKIIFRAWSRNEAKEVAVSPLLKTSERSKSVSQ